MKKYLVILSIMVTILISLNQAKASVIYNTFGPGDSYNPNTGWTLSNVHSQQGHDYDQGDAFTPNNDFLLGKIELAAGWSSGTNELDVWLMNSTASGAPGSTIIESFHFSGIAPLGSNPILVGNSVSKPTLNQGVRYWLIGSAPGEDGWLSWNLSNPSIYGPHAYRTDSGSWNVSPYNEQGAFRISGTEKDSTIPEPSTVALLIPSLLFGVNFISKNLKKERR